MPPPVIKYHGGKHFLATKILTLMPAHIHYVEPYFGGGAVLLKKDPAKTSEVVNDIDRNLTNFWQVLQNPTAYEEFKRRMEATPFSQVEWVEAGSATPIGHLDTIAAINFFIKCRQSLSGRSTSFAPISKTRLRRGMNEQCSAWISAIEGLPHVHSRLQRVFIYNDDAITIIKKNDSTKTLFYLDPTYPSEVVSANGIYTHHMTDKQHLELLKTIIALKGKVIISSYPNKMYDKALQNWSIKDFNLPNNAAGGKTKKRMTERVYMNY